MVVTEAKFDLLIADLQVSSTIGFDVETYGTGYHDRLFSLALATANESYYLNFNYEADHSGMYPQVVLPRELLKFLEFALNDTSKTWFAHNAAFDMQKMRLENVAAPRKVHCTYITERLIRNDSMDLSLDAVARKYGYSKDASVEEYIEEFKLYTQVELPGKERKEKVKHFDQVPFEIISRYGEIDAQITRAIGLTQLDQYFSIQQ